MINAIFERGFHLLSQTFVVGAAVQTYIDGANRDGMVPFRVVILDSAFTIGVGTNGIAPVKYPDTNHTHGERVIGVAYTGVNHLNTGQGYDAGPAGYPILPGRSMEVRMEGIAAIMTDTSTAGTPISPGDQVSASTTANMGGLIKKSPLTNNAPSASQHVVGVSLSKVIINNGVALVHLRPQEV